MSLWQGISVPLPPDWILAPMHACARDPAALAPVVRLGLASSLGESIASGQSCATSDPEGPLSEAAALPGELVLLEAALGLMLLLETQGAYARLWNAWCATVPIALRVHAVSCVFMGEEICTWKRECADHSKPCRMRMGLRFSQLSHQRLLWSVERA